MIAVAALGFDVAILVQFSMARAEEAVAPAITGAVLMRPRSAVERLKLTAGG